MYYGVTVYVKNKDVLYFRENLDLKESLDNEGLMENQAEM